LSARLCLGFARHRCFTRDFVPVDHGCDASVLDEDVVHRQQHVHHEAWRIECEGKPLVGRHVAQRIERWNRTREKPRQLRLTQRGNPLTFIMRPGRSERNEINRRVHIDPTIKLIEAMGRRFRKPQRFGVK
jgi:hypothetical protein